MLQGRRLLGGIKLSESLDPAVRLRSPSPLLPLPQDVPEVVAVILTCRGRIGLFKRSPFVGSDVGRWHCITGYVDEAASTIGQAIRELREETGLELHDIKSLIVGDILDLNDHNGASWRVHTFLAATDKRRLQLNWEHVDYRWVPYRRIQRFDGQVKWLGNVLAVFGRELVNGSNSLTRCPTTLTTGRT
ncbi:NUDIX domain-containing protein [bacterium RCC_150]